MPRRHDNAKRAACRGEILSSSRDYHSAGGEHLSIEDSLIIKEESHQAALISWLPPYSTCSLLYRATTDGKKSADFHGCCDNKGPTLVVIKHEEYIFGGYTSQPWESEVISVNCSSYAAANGNYSDMQSGTTLRQNNY